MLLRIAINFMRITVETFHLGDWLFWCAIDNKYPRRAVSHVYKTNLKSKLRNLFESLHLIKINMQHYQSRGTRLLCFTSYSLKEKITFLCTEHAAHTIVSLKKSSLVRVLFQTLLKWNG